MDNSRISRNRQRTLAILVSALALLSAAVLGAAPLRQADARQQAPISATFATTGVGAPCGPQTVCVSVDGSGVASHLGRATIAKDVVVQITAIPYPGGTTRFYTADATLTAANGDTLTMSGSGSICAGPDGIVASGSYVITGGTGRFSAASGTIFESISREGTGPEITSLRGAMSAPRS